MRVEFDPAKSRSNVRKHGISLRRAEEMDFSTAAIRLDDREDYGELRYQAIGFVGDRLHSLVFTMRGDAVRAISLREASAQEEQQYAEEF